MGLYHSQNRCHMLNTFFTSLDKINVIFMKHVKIFNILKTTKNPEICFLLYIHRSSLYSSDQAKINGYPVLHVNADFPEVTYSSMQQNTILAFHIILLSRFIIMLFRR